MARPRLLPFALLLIASLVAVHMSLSGTPQTPSFLSTATAGKDDEHHVEAEEHTGYKGPLDWFHYEVILASRKSYPVTLMLGFNLYGNILVRKECGDKPYPNWLFGFPITFIAYTYPGAIFSDLMFVAGSPMRAMANNNILLIFTMWWCCVQYSEKFYKACLGKHTFIIITTWWLCDATRASLCFLERAVSHSPVFAKGIWQAFIWCAAGPLVRVVEASVRGAPVPPLNKLLPDSFNALKYPLVMMWMGMVFYMVYMALFTDCNLFGGEGALTMVECGDKHEGLYAAIVYVACFGHLIRAYYNMYITGGMHIFGDMCMSSTSHK